MVQEKSATVEACILDYATKGVFRSVKRSETETGMEYRFGWLSRLGAVRMVHDGEADTVEFRDMFPDIPEDARQLVQSTIDKMSGPDVLPHRGVDSSKARVEFRVADGRGSVVMHILNNQDEYAFRRLVNIVNELHTNLQLYNAEYANVAFGGFDE